MYSSCVVCGLLMRASRTSPSGVRSGGSRLKRVVMLVSLGRGDNPLLLHVVVQAVGRQLRAVDDAAVFKHILVRGDLQEVGGGVLAHESGHGITPWLAWWLGRKMPASSSSFAAPPPQRRRPRRIPWGT